MRRSTLLWLLTLAYGAGLVYLAATWKGMPEGETFRWTDLAGPSLLSVANSFLNAWTLLISCEAIGCRLRTLEALGLSSANAFFNLLPLRAGLGFKALYLKTAHGVSLGSFGSVTIALGTVTLVGIGLLGLGTVIVILATNRGGGPEGLVVLGLVYGAMMIAGVLFALAASPTLRTLGRTFPPFERRLKHLIEGFHRVHDRVFFVKILFLVLLILFIIALRLKMIAGIVDAPVPLSVAFLLSTAGAVATAVNIVPMGLGLREGLLSGTYVVLGGSLKLGLVVAVLDRLITTFWSTLIGGSWIWSQRQLLMKSRATAVEPEQPSTFGS